MTYKRSKLPPAWSEACISDVADINPRVDKAAYSDSLEVSFVPMPAVEAETGRIDISTRRSFGEVKKGFTSFQEGDVIFAKITPCMENGKMAIVPSVTNGLAFGSTEFHVIRPSSGILPSFIYYFVASKRFRIDAEHNMTGAVGQRRVPTSYLAGHSIPVPPTAEQRRIVAKIEELFSELDKGVESLKTAREQLKVYRQAVLKHAFEGKLTAKWREENRDRLASTAEMLARIENARAQKYKQQLGEWENAVKEWQKTGTKGPKPTKPTQYKPLPAIADTELSLLPSLPPEWTYHRLGEIAFVSSGMSVSKDRTLEDPVEVPYLRVANVQRGRLELGEIKTMRVEKSKLGELVLKKWDVLFNEGGDRDKLGRGWIWEDQVATCITQNHVFRATTSLDGEAHAKFVSHWGNVFGQDYFDKGGKQTTNLASINKTVLSMFPVPMPSLVEQEQIIKVIDDTLSVLDQTEKDIEQELKRSEALRQSILKKAFSGQLVPQDPNDEPASVLLERIRAEKAAQAKGGKRAKVPASDLYQ